MGIHEIKLNTTLIIVFVFFFKSSFKILIALPKGDFF